MVIKKNKTFRFWTKLEISFYSELKDGLINSNVELTSPDVLLGLANGFKLPLVTNFDGTKFTGTLSKEVENFKFQAQGTYSPETGKFWNMFLKNLTCLHNSF